MKRMIGLIILVSFLASNTAAAQTETSKETSLMSAHNPKIILATDSQLNPSTQVSPQIKADQILEEELVLSLKWTNDPKRNKSQIAK